MKVFISLFVFLLFVGNTYAGKADVFFRDASHSFYTFIHLTGTPKCGTW